MVPVPHRSHAATPQAPAGRGDRRSGDHHHHLSRDGERPPERPLETAMAAIRCVSCDGPLRRNHAGGGYTHLAPGSATLIDEFLDQDHPPSPVPQVLQRFAFLATAAGVDTQPTPDDLRRRHLRALRMAATG